MNFLKTNQMSKVLAYKKKILEKIAQRLTKKRTKNPQYFDDDLEFVKKMFKEELPIFKSELPISSLKSDCLELEKKWNDYLKAKIVCEGKGIFPIIRTCKYVDIVPSEEDLEWAKKLGMKQTPSNLRIYYREGSLEYENVRATFNPEMWRNLKTEVEFAKPKKKSPLNSKSLLKALQ